MYIFPRTFDKGRSARFLQDLRPFSKVRFRTLNKYLDGLEQVFYTLFCLFTYFERGNQIVIQMLEELNHEKSYCA